MRADIRGGAPPSSIGGGCADIHQKASPQIMIPFQSVLRVVPELVIQLVLRVGASTKTGKQQEGRTWGGELEKTNCMFLESSHTDHMAGVEEA